VSRSPCYRYGTWRRFFFFNLAAVVSIFLLPSFFLFVAGPLRGFTRNSLKGSLSFNLPAVLFGRPFLHTYPTPSFVPLCPVRLFRLSVGQWINELNGRHRLRHLFPLLFCFCADQPCPPAPTFGSRLFHPFVLMSSSSLPFFSPRRTNFPVPRFFNIR